MDIEDLAIRYVQGDSEAGDILRRALVQDEMEALLEEIRRSEGTNDHPLMVHHSVGMTAGEAGLGCRGTGDSIIHRAITGLLSVEGLSVAPRDMDDSGAVPFGEGHIVVSVDGLHSRLSRFPFLSGFHAARAALRDVMVMGGEPLAITSDIHVGDDADVGVVLDMTAGVAAVSRLTGVPVAGGSTLRIGGDMMKGSRLTGSVGAVGFAHTLTARRRIEKGDVIIMTIGSGGGTIATTAIYHGMHDVVRRTINVDFHRDIAALTTSGVEVHAMADVTNGGIRGDAADLVAGRSLDILLEPEALRRTVDPVVLDMLDGLGIDHLGISTDSILAAAPGTSVDSLLNALEEAGGEGRVVGRVEEGNGRVLLDTGNGREELQPLSREAPYTPLKAVVAREDVDITTLGPRVNDAAVKAAEKSEKVVQEVLRGDR